MATRQPSMVDAIHAFLLRETAASVGRRAEFWHRDYRSPEAFERSISPNRERFRSIIGAVDPRLGVTELQLEATTGNSAEIASRQELSGVCGPVAGVR